MLEERAVGFEIQALSNLLKREFAAHAPQPKPNPVTAMQGRIVGMLCREPQRALFQRDIEAALQIRRSTATGILQLMEKNGLLLREPVPYDARLKRLVPTETAQRMHAAVERELAALEARLRHGLSEEELAQFFHTIDRMKQNLGWRQGGPCACGKQEKG